MSNDSLGKVGTQQVAFGMVSGVNGAPVVGSQLRWDGTAWVPFPTTALESISGYTFDYDPISTKVTLVSGLVSQWTEKIGTDANRNAVQAVAGNRPTYNATDAAYGNKPTIQFGVGGAAKTLTTGVWATPPFDTGTLYLVGNSDNTAALEFFLQNTTSNTYEIYQNAANQLAFTGVGTVTGSTASTPNLDQSHIWAIDIGALGKIRQDDTSTSAGSVVNNTGANLAVALQFGSRAGAFFLIGKIARFIGYNVVHTRAQRTSVMWSLAAQYGLIVT